MIRVFVLASAVLLVVIAIYLVVAIARMVKRSAWPGDSPQYRNHLNMARWIERQLRDDMVNVTIPEGDRREAAGLLREFYDAPHLGEGS